MQFYENGPDIPIELVNALEKDKLVFFCGAGVSSTIPEKAFGSFRSLLERVVQDLNYKKDLSPKDESVDIEKIFQKLEEEFDQKSVEECIRRCLTLKKATSMQLRQHKAILNLSHSLHRPTPRLITTNFDNCFDLAWQSRKMKKQGLTEHCANALPVPDKGWSSIVYLHGKANTSHSDLIYSSKGFAKAYLWNQWAVNFLRVLFQEYKVAFIGYGMDDPIMKYVVQAVRESDQPYIFIRKGNLSEDVKHSIIPISYNDHQTLWNTIEQWGQMHKQGRDGWVGYAQRELAGSYPLGLDWSLSEIKAVKNMTQVLSDTERARALVSSCSLPLGWLQAFRKIFEKNKEGQSAGVQEKISWEDFNVLQPDNQHGRIANKFRDSRDLHPVTAAIGNWLADGMFERDIKTGKYPVMDYVIENGSIIHPSILRLFKDKIGSLIKEQSEENPHSVNSLVIQAWEILLFHSSPNPDWFYDSDDYALMDLSSEIGRVSITQRLCNQLKPRLTIKKARSYSSRGEEEAKSLNNLLDIDISLSCYRGSHVLSTGSTGYFHKLINHHPHILVSLVEPIESHLQEVTRLSALFQSEEMLSFIYTFNGNKENRINEDTNWVLLIDWLWAGFDLLPIESKERKIENWSNEQSLLFRRLAMQGSIRMMEAPDEST